MPKLDDKRAQEVENAEDGFKPIPEGVYILQLMEDVDVKEGDKGVYWKWTFEIPEQHDGKELEHAGRRFWTNTSLTKAADFKMKEMFAGFGVPANTDTAELVGRKVKAQISIRTIQGGPRKGELSNEIAKVFPLAYDEEAAAKKATEDAKGGSTDEPMF